MTEKEFSDWAALTEKSTRQWNHDEVTFQNKGDFLAYTGGAEEGVYVLVEVSKKNLSYGIYKGAVPHIGEAVFEEQFREELNSVADAFYVVQLIMEQM